MREPRGSVASADYPQGRVAARVEGSSRNRRDLVPGPVVRQDARVPLRPILRRCCAVLALALPGCAAFERYARDRLMDVTDIVDFKYGRAWGLGVKLEATLYLGSGLGLGEQFSTREWFGRHGTDFELETESGPFAWVDGAFVHLGVIGFDGGTPTSWAQSAVNTVGLNILLFWAGASAPPLIDRWRFGGELLLPGVIGGMYLNLGECWDLFAGVFGGDPAEDDGLLKEVLPVDEE
jgi:hypothetical protein